MNNNAMKLLELLTDEQFDFIKDELGFDKEQIASMSEDEIDQMYDKITDIEVDEVCKVGGDEDELSIRGNIASDIVTAIGNELYRPDDEEDFEFEEEDEE